MLLVVPRQTSVVNWAWNAAALPCDDSPGPYFIVLHVIYGIG